MNPIQVKIKKLHPDAVIPRYAKPGDAGMDITAVDMNYNGCKYDDYDTQTSGPWKGYSYIEYKTGLAFEIPAGYVGLLFPRSSCSETDLTLANCVGVIDSGYRGEVSFRFKYGDIRVGKFYKVGDRIGQIIIMPYPEVEFIEANELGTTERGAGGFGSTNHRNIEL